MVQITSFLYSILIHISYAAVGDTPAASLTNPITGTCQDLNCALSAVVTKFLVPVATPILTIMALWGGFQLMTAGGDEQKISSGRKTLLWAAIGFAVVLLASGVAGIVSGLFTTS